MELAVVEATHKSEDKVQKYYSWRAANYDAGTAFIVGNGNCAGAQAD